MKSQMNIQYIYPVSQSWDMGIGTRFDEISTDGCSWENRKTSTKWLIGSASLESSGSFNGKGGMWFTGSYVTQSFSYESVRYSDGCNYNNEYLD